ncbi:hypothetical protein LC653_39400 [Nostoc sp. CHAB 5784]|uniref:hypothetical protein n=1 Tax=Nostoc mirabile TaxID=2907820 RepID=UPI001E3A997A|nr:hypothetical protein [Nostoc mirabile]MCC5669715.1 hypothetical protein [Nostoc mirabile CHAB5784]
MSNVEFNSPEFAKTFTHRTAQVNETQIHYVIGGHGDPLVLLSTRAAARLASNLV